MAFSRPIANNLLAAEFARRPGAEAAGEVAESRRPMQNSKDIQDLRLTLVVYVLVFAAKLWAYWASSVVALLAEALHTLSDIFVSGFLLVAAIYSRRQADERYMFGYGRAQNVAALVAATLFISFTSLELYREAIPRLAGEGPAAYENLNLALGVVLASMAVAALPLVKLFLRRSRGAAARAQFLELINDELGLLAALAAILAVTAGYPLFDPIAAIAVATLIAFNAVMLFRENAGFLIGRSPGREFLAQIETAARSVPGVIAVRDLRAEYVGPDQVHAGLKIGLAPELPVQEATRIADEVHRRVHQGMHTGYCFIQIVAAGGESAGAVAEASASVSSQSG